MLSTEQLTGLVGEMTICRCSCYGFIPQSLTSCLKFPTIKKKVVLKLTFTEAHVS